jgi:hypothetical protein
VSFGNAAQPKTTATFSQPGHYVLALSIADDVHAVTYDPIAIDVLVQASVTRENADAVIEFPTISGRLYRVEFSGDLSSASWTTLADNLAGTGAPREVRDPGALAQGRRFYRVHVLP